MDFYNSIKPLLLGGTVIIAAWRAAKHYAKNESKEMWFAIGKSIGLNFMVNTRKLYLIVVTGIITIFMSYVLGWFHMDKLSLGLGLVIGLEVLVYQLDRLLRYDNLPFETTVRYFVVYVWQYWFKKKQLFQDKRLNSNSKRYKIL